MAPSTRFPQSVQPTFEVLPDDPEVIEVIDLADRDDPVPADDIVDLTDRRRVLLLAVFGVEVPPETADAVFDVDPDPADQR